MVEPIITRKHAMASSRGLSCRTRIAGDSVDLVTGRTSKTANYLIRDKKAVEAAVAEYGDYLELCARFFTFSRPAIHGLWKTLRTLLPSRVIPSLKQSPVYYDNAGMLHCRRDDLDESERAAILEITDKLHQFNIMLEKQNSTKSSVCPKLKST
jgi:hypothetical protein